MKSVLLSLNPSLRIIDISHEIEPRRVRSAAYTLWAVHRYLPEKTIFVSVVDPGVGGDREVLIAIADGKTYIAPDNGLLDFVLEDAARVSMYSLSLKKARPFLPKEVSRTFHGRDLFAPVAARLAVGVSAASLGVKKKFRRPLDWKVDGPGSKVPPAILSVDRFGNIITNIVTGPTGKGLTAVRAVSVGKVMISVPVVTFSTAPDNTPCMMSGSSGLLEVVVKDGNAASMLRITDRSPIRVVWTETE